MMGMILKPSVFPQLAPSSHLDSRALSSYSPSAWGWESRFTCCSLQLKKKNQVGLETPINDPSFGGKVELDSLARKTREVALGQSSEDAIGAARAGSS